MYTAQITEENGATETHDFEEYKEMCKWLAQYPAAGQIAWLDGQDVDAAQLAEDVSCYL